jgi:hypothetical protein
VPADTPSVSVVLPVHNNEPHLAELVSRLQTALESAGRSWELIFVDDESTDGSAAIMRQMATHPRIRLLRMRSNVGQHRAALVGLAEATGDRAVIMDADLQDAPEAIPPLLDALDAGASVAFVSHEGNYQPRGRMATSVVFKSAIAAVSGMPIDRKGIASLLAFRVRRPYLPAMLALLRLPASVLRVQRASRPGGGSSYSGGMRLAAGLSALPAACWWRLTRAGVRARRRAGIPDPDLPSPDHSWRFAVAVAAVMIPIAVCMSYATPLGSLDEPLFLQVSARVAAGEVLYRDVSYNNTPLSVWATAAALRVFGAEVIVLRGLIVVFYAIMTGFMAWIARRLGVGRAATLAAVAALVGYSPVGLMGPGSAYSPLSILLFVIALAATLVWLERYRDDLFRASFRVGVLIALTFATKHNVGVFLAAAYILVVVGRALVEKDGRLFLRTATASLGGFAAAFVPILAVIAATGGWDSFLFGVGDKSLYLQYAGIPYMTWLEKTPGIWTDSGTQLPGVALIARLMVFVLPVPALALAVLAWLRRRDPRAAMLGLFGLAAWVSGYPRWDLPHLAMGAPVLLLAVVAGWSLLRPPRWLRWSLGTATIALAVATGVLTFASYTQPLTTDYYAPVDLPHYRVALMEKARLPELRESVSQFARAAQGHRLYVISPRSGLLYLAAEQPSRTPYDLTLASDTGTQQMTDIEGYLASGRIDGFWIDSAVDTDPSLRPDAMLEWVRANLRLESTTTVGSLYLKVDR